MPFACRLNNLKKSWIAFALCFLMACEATAEIKTIIFDHGESKISHLLVVKGSEVSLKNDNHNAIYNLSLINAASGKSLVSVAEISAGDSFRMEFGKEGLYRLYYTLQPDEFQDTDRYVLIDVIAAHPA